MSLIKTIKQQLGLSVTPANNFTITAEADNGTMKLARGNAGATTQDILTVDASGKVDIPQLARSLGESGYYTLPGGLIIQWGKFTSSATTGNPVAITYPIPFPTNTLSLSVVADYNVTTNGAAWMDTPNATGFNARGVATSRPHRWIAIGY